MIQPERRMRCGFPLSRLCSVGLLAYAMTSAARGDGGPASPGRLVLSRAVVVAPGGASKVEANAVRMLVEDVERRSGVRWEIRDRWPERADAIVIAVGRGSVLTERDPRLKSWLAQNPGSPGAEGYRIGIEAADRFVLVAGNDARGVLFGVGRLLRELTTARGRVELPPSFRVATAPRLPVRGHQLGYRPKTNSYDGWDLDQWERYIRDLATFGTNAIELIPPRSDDNADSPHFPRPPLDMMVGMSRLADDYGLDVWVWYPAIDRDYSDPKSVETAVKEWSDVLSRLPRLDAVFVPGGDPGHTRPRILMPLLEKQAEALGATIRRRRCGCRRRASTASGSTNSWRILRDEPAWLAGVVFGPQIRVSLAELRSAVPQRYPIRGYPDITHTINCQHPVPDWDLAYALTLDREPINPRPLDQAAIFRMYRDRTVGFISYSEGCNDDVNKFVWSGLGWDPETPVVELLRQYARAFLPDGDVEGFTQGLSALERNWRGPLLTNASVETTLGQFRAMDRAATPRLRQNWRFQQALYRAYYDAYVRDRLIAETAPAGEGNG